MESVLLAWRAGFGRLQQSRIYSQSALENVAIVCYVQLELGRR